MGNFSSVALGAVCILLSTAQALAAYPKAFTWGVAMSAHQTEGMAGGAENGDWWQFEHSLVGGSSPIANGDTTDVATDHWHRYAEDFALARDIGVDSVRISIAWEKVEPEPGVFNEAVLAHYQDELHAMRAAGLRPMVALHHYTHPAWFHAAGGWLSSASPQLFLEYARHVVDALGDQCDLWITFNEPMVLVYMGYITGQIPPNLASMRSGVTAAVNLARAHRLVTAMIHAKQGVPAASDHALVGVGFVNSLQLYQAKHVLNPAEDVVAKTLDAFSNWALPHLAVEGTLPFSDQLMLKAAGFGDAKVPVQEAKAIGDPRPDWFGVNYYTRYQVRVSGFKVFVENPAGPQGDNGWAVYPQGLKKIVREAASRFHVPLVVSENGIADATDHLRPQAIRDTLSVLDGLVLGDRGHAPMDIRGYYHWSLTDNFEWLSGYQYRFGLIEIRYDENLKRVPRPSAEVYHDEIARRRADP